jgi:hypothetical protein
LVVNTLAAGVLVGREYGVDALPLYQRSVRIAELELLMDELS